MTTSTLAVILMCVFVAIIVSPLVTIWALNTLFGLGIPSTAATYFAALWLNICIAAKSGGGK